LIFHLTAIHSNADSIIAFNEPEARAFPYYTKELAESISLDDQGNQYFITTHNPYFLTSILDKTKENEVHINVTYMENFETKNYNHSILAPSFNIQDDLLQAIITCGTIIGNKISDRRMLNNL